MSDRIDRAAQVIGDALGVDPDIPSGAMYVDATDAARALDEAGLLAPAPNPAPWWRVIGPGGGVWCETSSESEARQKSRPGDTLHQLWETPPVNQWKQVDQ